MIPTNFDHSNAILTPPDGMDEDECGSLFVFSGNDDDGLHWDISCWKLTADELRDINETGRIWLHVVGRHPPVHLGTKDPFS
jgi:hypothetical protein